jgi:anti-sigma B factor antagonist
VSESPRPKPAATRLEVVGRVEGGVLVLAVSGEVDLETAPTLRTAVRTAIDQTAGEPCIVDLTAVTFLDSTGLSALLDATQVSQARQEPLRIVVDTNRPVIRPIMITGLDEVLALYDTVKEALNAGRP